MFISRIHGKKSFELQLRGKSFSPAETEPCKGQRETFAPTAFDEEVANQFKYTEFTAVNVGFIPSVKREVNTVLNTAFGPVAIRKRALQDKIGQMNDSIANKERQLARKEEQLRNKFAKLEETMSKMKGQMGQVAAAGMAGGGGGGIPGMG